MASHREEEAERERSRKKAKGRSLHFFHAFLKARRIGRIMQQK
jgi:hypothetical protein